MEGFDASVLIQGVGKQDVFLDGALIEGPTWENFFGEYLLDYWTPDESGREVAPLHVPLGSQPERTGLQLLVRPRRQVPQPEEPELRLLAAHQPDRTRWAEHARLYVAGTNVFNWSPLKGIVPPEANPNSTRATYYYQTRNWSVGTSLGF